MKVLVDKVAENIRALYLSRYIDKESEYFKERVLKRIECSDGLCYRGYLWDCFKTMQLISKAECEKYLRNFNQIYIMWDINSKDYIFIPDYWKYPKEAILVLSLDEYYQIKEDLPEDIYIFDETFSWSIALTHETTSENEIYCCFTHSEGKYDAFPDREVYDNSAC